MQRRLYRSQHNRVLLGVCGGLGEYFNSDPVIFRVIWVVVTLFTGIFPGVIAYFVVALVVPIEGSTATSPRDHIHEGVSDIRDTATSIKNEVQSAFNDKNSRSVSSTPPPETAPRPPPATVNYGILYLIGIVILALGVIIILNSIFHTALFWAGLLIAAGLVILLLAATRSRS